MTLASYLIKLILSFVIIFNLFSITYGQDSASEDYGKGSFTLGVGTALDHEVSTLTRLQIGGRRFVNLSYNVSGDLTMMGGSGIQGIQSLSVEAGMTHMLENRFRTRIVFTGGPAYVWTDRDDFNQTVGLSAGAQIVSEPLIKGLGLGFDLYGNLNAQKSFTGVRVLIQFTDYN